MNKFLVIAVASLLLAPNAFASKARLISLGQSPNGSEYITDDTRTVFLNPAYINTVGDFADFEMGNSNGTTPNSEGGFFHKWNGYHVGLQLGRQSDFNDLVTSANSTAGATPNFVNPQNTLELQFGTGDATKFGVSLIYGMTEQRPGTGSSITSKASTYELRGGIIHDALDAYIALDMLGTAQNDVTGGSSKLTENPSLKVGVGYDMSTEEKVFIDAVIYNYKTTQTGSSDQTENILNGEVGYAHFLNPDAATKFFYSVALAYNNDNLASTRSTAIPLVIGVENAATDWLKLRGSVTQNVIIDQRLNGTTNTNNPNSTTVSAGAGITWKKITLDGTLAGSNGGSAAMTGTQGKIDATNFLANASLTYMF